jgi:release factor glutamine methyltransferase
LSRGPSDIAPSFPGARNPGQPAGPDPPVLTPDARAVASQIPSTGAGAGQEPRLHEAEPPRPGRDVLTGAALLAWRRQLLQGGGRSADLDWLLDLAAGLSWSALQRLWLQPQRQVILERNRSALEAIWGAYRRGEGPLQYLVGRSPWRDLILEVGPGVLIPRQETELLVELLLEPQGGAGPVGSGHGRAEEALWPRPAPALWADLGTGSGCLAIALARAFPGSTGLAVDLSGAALAQAGRNLDALGLSERVTLLHGSWWDPLQPWWGQLDLVVANPPYIPSGVVSQLDPMVRDHEPRLALDGGVDGLASLSAILALAPQALAPEGRLLVEHHHDQSAAVLALMETVGLHQPLAHRDLEGVQRFASASRSHEVPGAGASTVASGPTAPAETHPPTALPSSGLGGVPLPR